MSSIKIYRSVKLHKHEDGTFSYTDTYGEDHEFDSANEVWEHLTGDGEEFDEEVEAFVFGDEMTLESLTKAHKPETKLEREALANVSELIGTWPECATCKRCVPGCQLIIDQYDGFLADNQ